MNQTEHDMPLATTNHGTLHYDVIDQVAPWQGPREAIVFHHGIGGSAGIWAGWWSALVDGYRLVAFDMRGCGRSIIPPADFAWSLDLLVDDLFAVADAAGLEQISSRGRIDRRHGCAGGSTCTARADCHAHRQQRRPSRHLDPAGRGVAAPARLGRRESLVRCLPARPLP